MSIHCPKCHASRAHLEAREVHGRQEVRCLRCGFLDVRAIPPRRKAGRRDDHTDLKRIMKRLGQFTFQELAARSLLAGAQINGTINGMILGGKIARVDLGGNQTAYRWLGGARHDAA